MIFLESSGFPNFDQVVEENTMRLGEGYSRAFLERMPAVKFSRVVRRVAAPVLEPQATEFD